MKISSYGEIRIIGGNLRGRKLEVPNVPDLRPTPNRVRETLFNWLMPHIQGAHCLDPFAGSGALGFEALSRGASSLVMMDQSHPVIKLLKDTVKKFKIEENLVEIYLGSAPDNIQKPRHLFDIVFLDPPFNRSLLLPTCFFLEEKNYLAKNALIYLEAKESLSEKDLPAHWKMIKSKKAGKVYYYLVQRIG